MYPKDDVRFGVASTLCYGVQWDTALDFIKSDSYVVYSDCTNNGNYSNSAFQYSNDGGSSWTTKSGSKLLMSGTDTQPVEGNTTWKGNKSKNIYDMAGNIWEWTMETWNNADRVYRGGSHSDYGHFQPASLRVYDGANSGGRFRRLSCCTLRKIAKLFYVGPLI